MVGIPVLIFVGLLCCTLPWYIVILICLAPALFILFLRDFRLSLYFMICLVPISADWLGFCINTTWSNALTDMIPVFVPILFMAFLGLFLKTMAGLHSNSAKTVLNKLFLFLFFWAVIVLLWSPNLSIKATDTNKGKVFTEVSTISRNTTPLMHDLLQLSLLASNMLLFYLIINAIDSETFHRRLMTTWIIFGGLIAAFCLWMTCSSHQTATHIVNILDFLTFRSRVVFLTVRGAALGTPNLTSFVLNMMTGITFGMLLCERKMNRRILLGAVMLFMILSNMLTLTKAGLLALIVMLHFFLIVFRRLRRHFFLNLITMYAVLMILFFLQLKISKEYRVEGTPRFLAKSGYSDAMASRIKYVWNPGIKELSRNGFVGLGAGTFTYATTSPHGHSIYFSTLFDFGIVGVMAVLLVFLVLVRSFLMMSQYQETYLQIMFISCSGVLLSIGIHGLVDFEYNTPVVWLFLGFYMATFLLAKKELSDPEKYRPDDVYLRAKAKRTPTA